MTPTSRDLLASFAGHGGVAALTLLFTPVYVKALGVEAYGLVGFYLVLVALLASLDLGLGIAINRRLATPAAVGEAAGKAWDHVRTLELAYWGFALLFSAALLAAAPWLATDWLRPHELTPGEVRQTVALMAATLVCQLPVAFYANALAGLHRQVPLNALQVGMALVRLGGAALLVWFAPTLQAFFAWQAIACALHVVTIALVVRLYLPRPAPPRRLNLGVLRGVWRFSAGMTGIALVLIPLTQGDKLLLSRLASLQELGYYMLAHMLASGLLLASAPVAAIMLPRFAALQGRERELAELFHQGCRTVSLLLLPLAAVLLFFAPELIVLWTGSATIATHSAPVARLLVVGTLFSALNTLPFALQVAHGWTRLTLWTGAAELVMVLPLLVLLVSRQGGVGAALCWVLLNAATFTVYATVMFRRLLAGHRARWLLGDIAAPALACALLVGAARLAWPAALRPIPLAAGVAGITALAVGASFLAGRYGASLLSSRAAALSAAVVREDRG